MKIYRIIWEIRIDGDLIGGVHKKAFASRDLLTEKWTRLFNSAKELGIQEYLELREEVEDVEG